ncbi:type III secretion protein [Burkholderia territorii]|uniref:Type III secretion protein n=1 Tax=Burkholderia territorii TaxID=1503055 RepID=A0A125A8T2_9BURK|nr:flagellar biosynthetic protein FliR [Burkholderia territorii]KVV39187.1 type III secretion protein [Burkholderia territorii]KVX26248.1 type III secretion protein [Burkholderia territorii]
MSVLDDAARTLTVVMLLLARGYGLLFAVPVVLKAGQGWMTRLPIALALALPSFPLAYHAMPDTLSGGHIVFAAVREVVLGALTGVFFLPLFAVPRAVGTFVDQQAGLMSIQLFDPTSSERSATLFADIFEQFALFMFVVAGGFGVLGELYMVSNRFWPVAAEGMPSLGHAAELVMLGFGTMFDTSIRYAAPFVSMLILLEYGIGLVGRAAPQLNILTTSVAIKMVAALVLTPIVAPFYTDAFGDAFVVMRTIAAQFLDPVVQR